MQTTTHLNEGIARRYYELVDADRVDDLLALFHDDIEYQRQGTETIRGIKAMRRFYEGERIIAGGEHRLDQVLAGDAWVAVRGRFEGVLRSGEQVALRFTDWLHFRDGLIVHRESLFPGRQV
ncbi:nuclear transport factor 2 family protein [Actinomadura hibisca]|uniref:nuclear transport factor 2 family protein n=1 Tax=Actinomadura hibisca TaxID=68565 RepID=UPI00082C29EE|nr:nuclear transport factor 2 family protein [Actinomadura hibisca]